MREPGTEEWVRWEPVASFAHSAGGDRHFVLDPIRGEVRFGPAIRQPDGGWRQFGAVPAGRLGAPLHPLPVRRRARRQRRRRRVDDARVAALRGVAGVTNPRAAAGGADAESLESARRRAALELRARSRAVTVEDFERLTLEASPRVARALCSAPHGERSGPSARGPTRRRRPIVS